MCTWLSWLLYPSATTTTNNFNLSWAPPQLATSPYHHITLDAPPTTPALHLATFSLNNMATATSGLDQAVLDAISHIVSEAIAPLRLDITTIKDDIITMKDDITGIKARLDNVDGHLGDMNASLDNVNGCLGGMDDRLNIIDAPLVQVRENGRVSTTMSLTWAMVLLHSKILCRMLRTESMQSKSQEGSTKTD
jgi:hypothetical protein